jgi:hypothetical protein
VLGAEALLQLAGAAFFVGELAGLALEPADDSEQRVALGVADRLPDLAPGCVDQSGEVAERILERSTVVRG